MPLTIRSAILTGLILSATCCDVFAQCSMTSAEETMNRIIDSNEYCFLANRVKTTTVADNRQQTLFEITQVLKAPAGSVKAGDQHTLSDGYALVSSAQGKREKHQVPGSSVFVVSSGSRFSGQAMILCESNQAVESYLTTTREAIASLQVGEDRRKLFVPYLGNSEPTVFLDAFYEITANGFDDIARFKEDLPRTKLLAAFTHPDTNQEMVSYCGLLLGVCGNADDVVLLENKVLRLDRDFRLGIEATMVGYMLLHGEKGLKVIEDTKLQARTGITPDGTEVRLPLSETYAGLQALRFLWTNESNRIPRERLLESMRILLDRPELSDLIIKQLSQWKDWESQDRIIAMLDDGEFKTPVIQRAIVRFLHDSSEEVDQIGKDGKAARPEHAIRAQEALKSLRKENPKLVHDTLSSKIRGTAEETAK